MKTLYKYIQYSYSSSIKNTVSQYYLYSIVQRSLVLYGPHQTGPLILRVFPASLLVWLVFPRDYPTVNLLPCSRKFHRIRRLRPPYPRNWRYGWFAAVRGSSLASSCKQCIINANLILLKDLLEIAPWPPCEQADSS